MSYLKKEVNDKVYFWDADKHRYKFILSISKSIVRHAQSTKIKSLEIFAEVCKSPEKRGR